MDAKIEDISAEMDNRISQFMIDNKLPKNLKPYIHAAAWIGASVISREIIRVTNEQEKDNQILNEVFNAIK